MSSTIDKRIVSMQFDNKQFESGVATSLKTLEKLSEKLQLADGINAMQNIGKAIQGVDFSKMQDGISKVSGAFSVMGTAARAAITEFTTDLINKAEMAVGKIKDVIVDKGISRAMTIEQSKFKLEGLGANVEEVFAAASDSVTDTAYGLDQAVNLASMFFSSGMSDAETLKNTLSGVAGLAATTGAEYDRVGQIFGKISGNGRIMTEELNQFATMGVNVAADMAEAFGMTEAEVRKAVTDGAIDAETFFSVITDKYAAQSKKSNEMLTGIWANVKAAMGRIGADFVTPIVERNSEVILALQKVKDIVNAIHSGLGDLGKGTGLIGDWAAFIKNAGEEVNKILASVDLDGLTKKIDAFYQSLKDIYGQIGEREHFLQIVDIVVHIGELFGTIFGTINDGIMSFYTGWNNVGEVIFSRILFAMDGFDKALKFINRQLTITPGILNRVSSIVGNIVGTVDAIVGIFIQLGKTVLPTSEVEAARFAGTIGNILSVLDRISKKISDILNGIKQSSSFTTLHTIIYLLLDAVNKLFNAFDDLLNVLFSISALLPIHPFKTFGDILTNIATLIDQFAIGLSDLGDTSFKELRDIIINFTTVFEWILEDFLYFLEIIKDKNFTRFGQGVVQSWITYMSKFSEIIRHVVDIFGLSKNDIELIAGIIENVFTLMSGTGNGMLDIINKALTIFDEMFPEFDLWNGILTVIKRVTDALIVIVNKIKSFVGGDGKLFETLLRGIFSILSIGARIITDIFNAVETLFGKLKIGEKLQAIVEAFGKFVTDISNFFIELNERLQIDDTIAAALGGVVDIIVGIWNWFELEMSSLSQAIASILSSMFDGIDAEDMTGVLSDIKDKITELASGIQSAVEKLGSINTDNVGEFGDSLKAKLTPVWEFLKGIFDYVKELGSSLKDVFLQIINAIGGFFKMLGNLFTGITANVEITDEGLNDMVHQGALLAIVYLITNVLKTLKPTIDGFMKLLNNGTSVVESASSLVTGINNKILGPLGQGLKNFLTYTGGAVAIASIGFTIMSLCLSLGYITTLDEQKLLNGTAIIIELIASIIAAIKLITSNKNVLDVGQTLYAAGSAFLGMGAGLMLIAHAAGYLTKFDSGALDNSVGTLIIIMAALSALTKMILRNSTAFGFADNLGSTILELAISIMIIAKAVGTLAKISNVIGNDSLGIALASIGGIMAALALLVLELSEVSKWTNGGAGITKIGFTIILLAISMQMIIGSMVILAATAKLVGEDAMYSMVLGVGVIIAGMVALVGIFALESETMAKGPSLLQSVGVQMVLIGHAIKGIVVAMALLAGVAGLVGEGAVWTAIAGVSLIMLLIGGLVSIIGAFSQKSTAGFEFASVMLSVGIAVKLMAESISLLLVEFAAMMLAFTVLPMDIEQATDTFVEMFIMIFALIAVMTVAAAAGASAGPAGAVAFAIAILSISTSIILMAKAISIFTVVMSAMALIPWNVLLPGMLKLGLVMITLGIVGILFRRAAVGIVGMSLALFLTAAAIANLAKYLKPFSEDLGESLVNIVYAIGDFLEALADTAYVIGGAIDEIVASLFEGLGAGIGDFAKSLLDLFTQLFEGLTEGVDDLVYSIGEFLLAVIWGVNTWLEQNNSEIAEALSTLFWNLLDIVLETIWNIFTGKGQDEDGFLAKLGDKCIEIGAAVIDGAKKGITEGINKIKEAVTTIVDKIKEVFTSLLGIHSPSTEAESYGSFFVDGFINGIIGLPGKVLEKLGDFLTSMIDWFTDDGEDGFVSTITGFGSSIVDFLLDGIGFIWDIIRAPFESFITTLTNFFSDPLGTLKTLLEIGQNIVEGIKNGISNFMQHPIETIAELGTKIIDKIKEVLGISSPSKVMEEIGGFFAQGFSVGVENAKPSTEKNTKDFGNSILSAFGDTVNADSLSDSMSDAFGGVDTSGFNLDTDMDLTSSLADPTITPVLDMSSVESQLGSTDLNSMLGGNGTLDMSAFGGDLSSMGLGNMDIQGMMNGSNGQMAELNDNLSYNNTEITQYLTRIQNQISQLQSYIDQIEIVMDTNALVGQLVNPMDNALGKKYSKR